MKGTCSLQALLRELSRPISSNSVCNLCNVDLDQKSPWHLCCQHPDVVNNRSVSQLSQAFLSWTMRQSLQLLTLILVNVPCYIQYCIIAPWVLQTMNFFEPFLEVILCTLCQLRLRDNAINTPEEQVACRQYTRPSPPPRRRGTARVDHHNARGHYGYACTPRSRQFSLLGGIGMLRVGSATRSLHKKKKTASQPRRISRTYAAP